LLAARCDPAGSLAIDTRAGFVALLLCGVLSAQAEEARKVTLDGVEMSMTRAGDNGLEIAYGTDVPVALREVGVTTGSLLVRGSWEAGVLIGEAFAFAKDCAPIAYAIRGVVDYGGSLVIIGPSPAACGGDPLWSKAAVMRFDAPARAVAAARSKQRAVEKPKPKPKPKPRAAPRPSYQQPQQWPGYYQQWRW
jgi:hypothetical protein